MKKTVDLITFLINGSKLDSQEGDGMFCFLRLFLNDKVFEEMMISQIVQRYPEIIRHHLKIVRIRGMVIDAPPLYNSRSAIRFCDFAFVRARVLPAISQFDWGTVVIDSLDAILEFCEMLIEDQSYSNANMPIIMRQLEVLISAGIEANAGVPAFLEKFSPLLLRIEFTEPFIREMERKANDVGRKQYVRCQISRSIIYLFARSVLNPVSDIPLRWFVVFLRTKLPTIDIGNTKDLFQRSVLDAGAQFDMAIPLHLFAYFRFKTASLRISCAFIPDVDRFFREWALLPLRYHFAAELSHFAFVRNTANLLCSMRHLKSGQQNVKRLFLTFSLVQTLLIETTEKEEFLSMIAWVSGIFSNFTDWSTRERHFIIFCFLHFVCC
jgi:hypothetical protein